MMPKTKMVEPVKVYSEGKGKVLVNLVKEVKMELVEMVDFWVNLEGSMVVDVLVVED